MNKKTWIFFLLVVFIMASMVENPKSFSKSRVEPLSVTEKTMDRQAEEIKVLQETQAPVETQAPEVTQGPEETQIPTATPPEETQEPEPTKSPEPTATPAPTMTPITQKQIQKGKWKTVNGKRCYKLENGIYLKGVYKIGKQYFAFSTKGEQKTPSPLLTGRSTRIVTIYGKKYLINKNAVVQKGWCLQGKKLYYFHGKKYCAVTNTKKDGIQFNKKGYAIKNVSSEAKITARKILKKIVRKSDSKHVKLEKAFAYMTNSRRWRYLPKYPNLSEKYWTRKLGTNMLKTRSGNCFGFACGFGLLAKEIGYKVKVVCGRVRGRRDHEADGYTHHAFIKINGKYYDPEGWWKGFVHAKGVSKYPMSYKLVKIVSF